MRRKIPASKHLAETREMLSSLGLNTVCQEALCPNLGECFSHSTATFMILGDTCTRNCSFCAVPGGKPLPPDPEEPKKVAEAARRLKLKHVVVTSVTRDDLPDGGAGHFAVTIEAIRTTLPEASVEVLTPDFKGKMDSLKTVVQARPQIYNHNLETIPRLYPGVRRGANYQRSLELIQKAKELDPDLYTKSGIMVGLGETFDEVIELMRDLRRAGCDILTIGQYLRPSARHLEIVEFVSPEMFETYRLKGLELGFKYIASAPYVRSSYHAAEFAPAAAEGQA